jgi:hypothetical protein
VVVRNGRLMRRATIATAAVAAVAVRGTASVVTGQQRIRDSTSVAASGASRTTAG